MQVSVTARNVELSQHVKDETVAKLTKLRRLFDRLIDMEVVFSEDRNPRIADKVHCEVVVHTKGATMRAEAAAPDPLVAIDLVQAKLRHQVRTLKGKRLARVQGRVWRRRQVVSGEHARAVEPGDDEATRAEG